MNTFVRLLAWCVVACAARPGLPAIAAASKPNIVFILADDLGYGDVHCLNPDGKIATPNMDRLAAAGMVFTDAHSSSAVCSPTRYGILTGRYNWRSRLKSGVLGGMSPPLIEPGRLTVPAFLKRHGYHTAGIGKWHLGLDWALKSGSKQFDDTIEKGEDGWRVDFTKPIAHGPTTVGFDSYFGIAASLDMVPYTFLENDRVTALPTLDKAFPMMLGRGQRSTRKGPAAAKFEAQDVLPTLTRKAVEYIGEHAADAKSGKPFFLYLPLNAPHTPIVPTPEWQGRSGLNPYADFVMETDDTVGQVLEALERNGLAGNTLVIMTSDNGCSPEAKFDELLAKGHNPSFHFRGYKADIFDGGHHIPFIARWPGRIQPGSRSEQLICLTDLFATCADILKAKLPAAAAEDSVSILPALAGRDRGPLREAVVHHSIDGSFAIRQAQWKLELCADSGGWSAPRPGTKAAQNLPPVQLYDLARDVGETNNVQAEHPEVVARLTRLLEKYVADGRSTPGPRQRNTTAVAIRRNPVATPASNGAGKPTAGGPRRPNILFLFSDDQRADTIHALGNARIQTPNLDRLARSGTVFTRAYCMGAMQGAVCVPSRAMLMTGRTLFRVKENLAGQATWPEMFGNAGYSTFISGKWHNQAPALLRSFTEGKAVFLGGMGNPYKLPLQDVVNESGERKLANKRESGTHSVQLIADAAVEFLRRQKGERSFLAYVAFNCPHDPRVAPPEYHRIYDAKPPPVPANFLPVHPFNNGEMTVRDEALAPWPRTPPIVRQHLADYYSYITFMDEQIGRILDALKASGQWDNTIIVFSSDHGLAIGSHGLFGKQNLYNHSMRAPLMFAGPGIPKGRRSDALCYLLDIFPTLGELTGLAAPIGSEGQSLAPVIRGETKSARDSIFTAYRHVQRAVRDNRWKLIVYPQINKTQLFDLRRDPMERRDLAGEKARAGEVQRMTALLRDWQNQLGETQPLSTNAPLPLKFEFPNAEQNH